MRAAGSSVCDSFPKWQFRLMRKGGARFTDFGHGQKEAELKGALEYLPIPYDHYGLSKGIGHWLDRHNRLCHAGSGGAIVCAGELAQYCFVARLETQPGFEAARKSCARLAAGAVFDHLHPAARFLEGRPGFVYCANLAYYEFLIRIKMREEEARRPVKHI